MAQKIAIHIEAISGGYLLSFESDTADYGLDTYPNHGQDGYRNRELKDDYATMKDAIIALLETIDGAVSE